MAKTKRHKQTRRQKKHPKGRRTRATHRAGGTKSFFHRFFTRSKAHQDHPFKEIEDDPADQVEDESMQWLQPADRNVYLKSFYRCHKSNMLTRRTRMGKCGKFDYEDGHKYDPSAYNLTPTLKHKLLMAIKSRLRVIVPEYYEKKGKHPSTLHRMYSYFMGHLGPLVDKAIDDFYVKTRETKQTLIDKKDTENENKIPRSNRDSVVFPARLYLTDIDKKGLKAEAEIILQSPLPQSPLPQPTVQPLSKKEENNYRYVLPVTSPKEVEKEEEEEEQIYSVG